MPLPTAAVGDSGVIVDSLAVPGGTLYVGISEQEGGRAGPTAPAMVFVPGTASVPLRTLALTTARADTGAVLTASATGGAMGISRTAGTSFALVGEATSSSAKTDKALWEFNIPDSYIAGSNISVQVNAQITGTGTLTIASCTITPSFYTEASGVETAGMISAAQQMVAAGSTLTFTITGTGLAVGQHCVLELVMLITSASGANTGQINSVAYQA